MSWGGGRREKSVWAGTLRDGVGRSSMGAMATVHRTACSRDCPDACSLLVTVEEGRAVGLRGDPDDPVTRGFLCERTGRFLARQHDPERITTPLLRRDGRLEPVGWDQALDHAAGRLAAIRAESGPAAVLHYRSGGSLGLLKSLADRLFERWGPVTVKRGDICSGAGEWAQERDFGQAESHDLFDLLHSRTIVLWGKNPHTSGVHLLPVLRRARAAGATILGVDPIRTRAAELCERFVSVRPGGDFALAMAVAGTLDGRGWIDPDAGAWSDDLQAHLALVRSRPVADWAAEADVALDDVQALAEGLARARPAALLVGWGLGRRRNGAAAVRALNALGVLSGNLGRRGGGVSYYFGRRTAFDPVSRGLEVAPRTLAEARLGAEILAADDPPVRAVWVTAGNPVAMLPDSLTVRRALEATEFTVVVDTHPTDTTDVADLVLPTLTLLEDDDLLGSYGHHWLRVSEPAVAPPPGPRHELEILRGLAERLGCAEALEGSVADWKGRMTRRLAAAGADLRALAAGPLRNPFAEEVLYADRRVPTASGKVALVSEPAAPPPAPDESRPFTLLAASTPKGQASQWSLPVPEGPPEARVHPEVADAHGGDGAVVELFSAVGALVVRLVADDAVRPDVVLMEKGGQLRHGRCANQLVAAVETDEGGGAAYYDELVGLRPVAGG